MLVRNSDWINVVFVRNRNLYFSRSVVDLLVVQK
jgi:hypothetical protein